MKVLKLLVIAAFSIGDSSLSSELEKQSRFLFLPFTSGGLGGTTSVAACSSPYSWAANLRLVCTGYFKCASTKGVLVGTCSSGTQACCGYKNFNFKGTTTTTTTTPAPATMTTYQNDIPAKTTTHTITRLSSAYCSVRVDFVDFRLEMPDGVTGQCLPDGVMTVSPSSNGVPDICGLNTGQHIYLDFPSSSDIINLNMNTRNPGSRWELKVTQIPCGSSDAAPSGCLQYFKSGDGLMQSFNFPGPIYHDTITYQLAETKYEICLGEPGSCSQVEIERNSLYDHSFTITGNVPTTGTPPIGDVAHLSAEAACTRDYVDFIDEGTISSPPTRAGKFCGLGFPDGTTHLEVPEPAGSTSSPFRVEVYTDVGEAPPDVGNAGFSLEYFLTCP